MKTFMEDVSADGFYVLSDGLHYSIVEGENCQFNQYVIQWFPSFADAFDFFLERTSGENSDWLFWFETFPSSEMAAKEAKKDPKYAYEKAIFVIKNAEKKTDSFNAELIMDELFDFITKKYFG